MWVSVADIGRRFAVRQRWFDLSHSHAGFRSNPTQAAGWGRRPGAAVRRPYSAGTPYRCRMLTGLRDPSGGPSMRVRLLSLLVVVGLLVLTAPLLIMPVLHWLLDSALP